MNELQASSHLGQTPLTPEQFPNDLAIDLDWKPRNQIPNGWSLERTLGRGRMAMVQLLRHKGTRRLAAMKVARPNQGAIFGLRVEGYVLGCLRGAQNAVQLDASCPDPVDSFLMLEYLDGQTVAQIIERRRIRYRTALRIAAGALRALCEAHQMNLLHRDIKPENLMLTEGQVKVIDWGLSMFTDGRTKLEKGLEGCVGTPLYMPPEYLDLKFTAEGDLYSLSCMLFQLLTGHLPFEDSSLNSAVSIIYQHQDLDGPSPKIWNRWIPQGLADLIQQMLRRNPRQRPLNAKQMLQGVLWYTSSLWARSWTQVRDQIFPQWAKTRFEMQ